MSGPLPWPEACRPGRGGTVLSVRLHPQSPREGVGEVREGRLVVRVCAPPVEERANRALVKLLARHLGVAPRRIEILKGERSRLKDLLIRDE